MSLASQSPAISNPFAPLSTPVPRPETDDSSSTPSSSASPSQSEPPSHSSTAMAATAAASTAASASKNPFPTPKLRLEIRDLNHAGATAFLATTTASTLLQDAIANVLRLLYSTPSTPDTTTPPTRSVTVILRAMPGVAYTTGSDLDADHKEIHFSLSYIAGIPADRRTAEITGVLTHELVHCYQWNARGTCPGGLIEGVADWVRLRCRLSPPHWKRETDGGWDGGYQHTAYFLDYLERRFGDGTVRRLNEKLRTAQYHEKAFWTELLGRPVEQLWGDYADKVRDDETVIVNKDDISDDDVRLGLRDGAAAVEGKPDGQDGGR
ncbi:hypothetical protein BN1708_003093 [Verticillium longisporum]|uniref:Uncharacterized protein n=1 Tax=Verticillium longisporum TaxID=100787 RepID=A0A0G4L719_VERLO|nr:hypothetical protein BN1708_003093 [Verticillium longisporum]